MFTLYDFQVKLVNGEEVKSFIRKHGELACVCYDTPKSKAEKVGEHCLKNGHFSGSRHLFFVFELECVPRFTVDQLVRHYTGFVPQVQSLRYCNKDGKVSLYAAPEIMSDAYLVHELDLFESGVQNRYALIQETLKDSGITGEKANEIARTVLPIGVAVKCNIALNFESLMHIANVRLCTRAELPIRRVTKEMVDQVILVEPRYKPYLVPQCKKLGYCPEGNKECLRYKSRGK